MTITSPGRRADAHGAPEQPEEPSGTAPASPTSRTRRSPRGRTAAMLGGGVALLITASVLGLGLGSHSVPPGTVVQALVAYDPSNDAHLIVVQSRLPRILLGALVGAALGLAGVLMQSMTRNPLADPGILGVNAGASLCVVVAIAYFGVHSVTGYIWFAFAGAALTAVLVYALGTARRSAATPVRIALAGTAVAIVISALTQMVLISNETSFTIFRYWALGSLQGRGADVIWSVLPFIAAGLLASGLLAGPLNALALGDDAASALGTRVAGTRIGAAAVVVVLAGAATASAGPIGFIGLGAAHIARFAAGNEHRRLLPASIVVGAALLVTADTLGRALVAPAELQTGLAAARFGAPLFIALVRSRRVAAL